MFFDILIQKWSFGLKFASQVVTLRGVFVSRFSKSTFFFQPGTDRKSARQIEYSYHIEVRTLNARRMFREQIPSHNCVCKIAGQQS